MASFSEDKKMALNSVIGQDGLRVVSAEPLLFVSHS